MEDDHQKAQDSGGECEGGEEIQHGKGKGRVELRVEPEGRPFKEVAEGDAEDDRGNGSSDKEPPVPELPPGGVLELAAVVEADRPEEEGPEDQQHGHIKAREGRGIDHGPGGKERSSGSDEPDLVAFPVRPHAVDEDTSLGIVLSDEGEKGSHSHVESVHHGKPDKEDNHENPPEKLECGILEHRDDLLRR